MNWLRTFVYFLFLAQISSVFAQPVKRLGLIDIEIEQLEESDKQKIIESLRENLSDQRILSVVREEEVEARLVQKNKLRSEVEKQKSEAQSKRSEIERQLEQARKYYLASQFEEAITVLNSAFRSLKEAALVMPSDLPEDILKFLAASHYFLGNEEQANKNLSAILDMDPKANLDATQFPPNFLDAFEKVRSEKRIPLKSWTFETNVKGLRAKMLGYNVDIQEGEKTSVKLPIQHPIWGSGAVVLEKEGFAPQAFELDRLPKEVKFLSVRDRKFSTRGLLQPIGSETPPVELRRIVVLLDLSVIFLGSAAKDLNGQWILKGQWLEGSTSRTSPVIIKSNHTIEATSKDLITEMLNFITPEGKVLSDRKLKARDSFNSKPEEVATFEDLSVSKPFYKTWWFWSLVGAGAIGAGVGSYYLLKPDETLKLQVRQQ